jgi:hypothetical protein
MQSKVAPLNAPSSESSAWLQFRLNFVVSASFDESFDNTLYIMQLNDEIDCLYGSVFLFLPALN